MRMICVFLFIMTPLYLVACYPAGRAPVQVTLAMETDPVMTHTPATVFVTTTPLKNEGFIPTLTSSPVRVTKTSEEAEELTISMAQPLTITVVYDNNPYDQRLKSAWGFSALIEYHDQLLLFDTGGDGYLLMENMRILGIDPTCIDSVVLSHAHEDHTGGLSALLNTGVNPVVYLPPSFPDSFKRQVEQFTEVNEVSPGQSIGEGLFTTGEMGDSIPEQALVIHTEQGLVIITGCSHPGIVAIVERAKELFAEPVRLVLGGFHLGSKTAAEIDDIVQDFRRLEVEQ
ncbi:MAG: MBL fold metallo-hydrolase, partial [Anaerolineales bacterium]|nr:MBL fold metallo-hydrolase [Anaerolineales bacterium]